jgi:hypothetical protein
LFLFLKGIIKKIVRQKYPNILCYSLIIKVFGEKRGISCGTNVFGITKLIKVFNLHAKVFESHYVGKTSSTIGIASNSCNRFTDGSPIFNIKQF